MSRPFGWKSRDELMIELVRFIDACPHGVGIDVIGTSEHTAFLYDRIRQQFANEDIVLAYVPEHRNHDLDTGEAKPREWISIGYPTKHPRDKMIYWVS